MSMYILEFRSNSNEAEHLSECYFIILLNMHHSQQFPIQLFYYFILQPYLLILLLLIHSLL